MILVTGGAGYIGSHACIELLGAGKQIVVFDNFVTGSPERLHCIEKITGKTFPFFKGDVRDSNALENVMAEYPIAAVMHFAGLKFMEESLDKPLEYYRTNVQGTLNVLSVMQKKAIHRLVFSSSAAVYGVPEMLPIPETHALNAMNPYGRSKLFAEQIIRDVCRAEPAFSAMILRYFNPVGAHKSGLLGENSRRVAGNVMCNLFDVVLGRKEQFNIYGNDFDTTDGTGVRDYIHVVDLAKGHLAALDKLDTQAGCHAVNLGTGTGYSVLELVGAVEKVSEYKVLCVDSPRRACDVGACYADVSHARDSLNWQAEKSVQEMCEDHWRWEKNNLRHLDADKF